MPRKTAVGILIGIRIVGEFELDWREEDAALEEYLSCRWLRNKTNFLRSLTRQGHVVLKDRDGLCIVIMENTRVSF